MKIVKRENDKIIEIEKVSTINDLDNSTLILVERGDAIKIIVKGARTMFGNKNLFSVKSMKEAIVANEAKQNKKSKVEGHFCCVCGDWFSNNQLNKDCVCHNCQLS